MPFRIFVRGDSKDHLEERDMASNQTSQLPVITCKPNGPYLVKGLAAFTNSRGEAIAVQETLALCRCGGSKNKPFCDGTHWHIKFKAD